MLPAILLVLALDLSSCRAFEAKVATFAEVTFLAIAEAYPSFGGGLVGAIPSPRYTILVLVSQSQSRILSFTADRNLEAKSSSILWIDPIAIFVGDPSAKDEFIARRWFSMIPHSLSSYS